jgi:hypothetical protein
MRHPFDGILPQTPRVGDAPAASTRRSFFGRLFALAGGAAATLFAPRASAQNAGGRTRGGPVTTQAVGEEGGRQQPSAGGRKNDRQSTTRAFAEEGGYYPPASHPTTYAYGEEGGYYAPDYYHWLRHYRRPLWYYFHYRPPYPRRRYTTQALHEEGH